MPDSNRNFWIYLGRFTVVHVLIYILIASIFIMIMDVFPHPTQTAFNTFEPYQPISLLTIAGQILRSLVLALVLYPFYATIVQSKRSFLVLFGALWGIALLGSVAPMPGSFEGVIYTETPLIAHLMAMAAGAVEVSIFAWLFLLWEKRQGISRKAGERGVVNHE